MVLSRQEIDEIRAIAIRQVDAAGEFKMARGLFIWKLMNVMIMEKIKAKGLLG